MKHGYAGTPTYWAWTNLLLRNRANTCPEWCASFSAFLKDMGEKPDDKVLHWYSDRGKAGPESCAWVPKGSWTKGKHNPMYRHGRTHTPTYETWSRMHQRTSNPNHEDYPNYGGRGIGVCAKWKTFEGFLEDMGERPEGRSLDRIDNSKGYSKENCRWATHVEQNRNRRNTVLIPFHGELVPMPALAERLGVSYNALRSARRHGKLARFLNE